ncbi:hypothetical protein WOSG25_040920 [Weissella oryzae SG25]|uniref:Competence protein ComGD n=1 Tax=Weissella oryzae (strain DSM 25784 / JCM 18191 / LMG 30913 / SG25) TaxID=1329250 RepID=A0A069CTB9_WEIOS|nr:hypothetical protein [Weissella oryzae]GAK30652.1 hypothetical protein WOSG25_040920 [Weissella oryzae SG25]
MKARAGFLLSEAILVLAIILSLVLLGSNLSKPRVKKDSWLNFEQNFSLAFDTAIVSKATFLIQRVDSQTIKVNETNLVLPTGWQLQSPNLMLVMRRDGLTSRPKTVYFMNQQLRQKKLVFQMGAGTYDFR